MSGRVLLEMQRVDVAHVIRSTVAAVQPAADAKQLRLQAILDPRAAPIAADPVRLQQVVWNLLSNAIKFTPEGGRVQVALKRANAQVEIAVSDTGQGIKSEFLPHVFERFRREDAATKSRSSGLGVGLSLVKHLVELHAGSVRVQSAGENQGATFVVCLPLTAVDAQSSDRPNPASSPSTGSRADWPSLRGLCVLVVDDEPDAREMLRRVLEHRHAKVILAPDTLQAINLLREHRPDVIVSDIGMPDLDGYEMIRLVRSLPADHGGATPAIALTAFTRSEDRRRAMLAGFQVHMAKPVDPPELVVTIASLSATAAVRSAPDDSPATSGEFNADTLRTRNP